MSDQDLICFCMSVTRGEIAEAVRNGETTIAGLKRGVGCCTGCGTCEERVKKVVTETLAAAAASAAATEKKAG